MILYGVHLFVKIRRLDAETLFKVTFFRRNTAAGTFSITSEKTVFTNILGVSRIKCYYMGVRRAARAPVTLHIRLDFLGERVEKKGLFRRVTKMLPSENQDAV